MHQAEALYIVLHNKHQQISISIPKSNVFTFNRNLRKDKQIYLTFTSNIICLYKNAYNSIYLIYR